MNEYRGKTTFVKTLCVDFDGVLHSYVSGWQGAGNIPDPPVNGALRWMMEVMDHPDYEIAIYSSRSRDDDGVPAMREWLRKNGVPEGYLEQIAFPTVKPSPYLTIDDRAICFRGTFPSLIEMDNFVPWNRGLQLTHQNLPMSDEEFAETCPPEPPTGEVTEDTVAETYEDRTGLTRGLGWEDIALTFAQNMELDGYDVEVQDNDGIVVKTHVYLYEWSGEVTAYINAQDAEGLINYLVGLNTTTEGMRDGTTIR